MNRLTFLLTLTLLTGCATTTSGTRNLVAEEENKRLARAFTEEIYNQRQLDRIPVYVAQDFVDESPGAPPEAKGPDFVRKQAEASLAALPDLRFDIEHLLADGELVLIHWKATGTDAKTLDDAGKPKQLTLQGQSLFRMRQGKIVESWDITDRLGFLLQRGFKLLPPVPAHAAPPAPAAPPAAPPAQPPAS
ncbi:MAG: ester cyclase [Hyalangium sp.]|uniref:ester cyclase n=1 Tax=Hyalangium sp. TaxID=2028555 RepID=UPI00389B16DE